jgi:hypothetical protein
MFRVIEATEARDRTLYMNVYHYFLCTFHIFRSCKNMIFINGIREQSLSYKNHQVYRFFLAGTLRLVVIPY